MPKARVVASRLYICGTAHLFTVGIASGLSPHDAPFFPILPHNVNKKIAFFLRVIHTLFTA